MIENNFESSSLPEQKVIKELKERWVSTKEVQQMLKRNHDDTMRWLDKITPLFLLAEKKAGHLVTYKILSKDDYIGG